MAQILQNPSFGQQLGSGLGAGFNQLIEDKLKQIQTRNQQKQLSQGLGSIPGITPDMAQSYSQLPMELLQPLLKKQLEAPGEQAYAQALSQLLGGEVPGAQVPDTGLNQGQTSAPIKGLNAKQATELAKIGLHKQEVQQKISAKEQQEIQKATQPYYEETLAKSQVAKDSEKRLRRMEELVKRGNLPNSGFYSALKTVEENLLGSAATGAALGGSIAGPVGVAVGGVLGGALSPIATLVKAGIRGRSPDSEEFEKLSADFVRDAKSIFGNRITDSDLRVFLQMIPTLSNTDEGKKVIIRNLKNMNKANEIRATVMKDIIKENGGRRPMNLQELVEERSSDELNKLAEQFISGSST